MNGEKDEGNRMTAPTPDLEAIAARAKEAASGPWRVDEMPETGECRVVRPDEADNEYDALWLPVVSGGLRVAEAEFVAHAREDIPALLDALAAVAAERDEVMLLAHRYANQATNAETERDQARQMLADAPHEGWCHSNYDRAPDSCTCWKAGL